MPKRLYEEKVDGYRILAHKDGERVRLISRHAKDLTARFPELVEALRTLRPDVHWILQGKRPKDIPIEQPTKLELAVKLKTAKAIGLAIPKTFLLRADAILE